MADTLKASQISPTALLLLGCAVVLAVTYVAGQKLAGSETTHVEASVAVQTRSLLFQDRPDGSIAILDAGATQPFETIAPQTNGFLRGTLRGMARARKLSHDGPELPFELTRWADGRLSLRDPATSREIALEPFGPTNIEVFKRLLTLKANAS
jgi:putative photosynthetic complex assembly protein